MTLQSRYKHSRWPAHLRRLAAGLLLLGAVGTGAQPAASKGTALFFISNEKDSTITVLNLDGEIQRSFEKVSVKLTSRAEAPVDRVGPISNFPNEPLVLQ